MLRCLSLVGLLSLAAAGLPLTLAGHCNGVVSELIVEDGSSAGQGLYLDDRSSLPTKIDVWLYLEMNTHDRLQSGGTNGLPGGTDPCMHNNPDLLIF